MSESSTSTDVESTSSRAPSAEPPALQDNECPPMDVAGAEPAAAASAPKWPDPPRHQAYNLAPNFGCACCVCGACYDTQWELTRHMGHWHPKESPFAHICAHCGRGFSKFYRMARHLAAVSGRVAESRGGTAADETRWPEPRRIVSRLNMVARPAPRRK